MLWGQIRLGRYFQKGQLLYDAQGRCHVYLIWMQTDHQTLSFKGSSEAISCRPMD